MSLPTQQITEQLEKRKTGLYHNIATNMTSVHDVNIVTKTCQFRVYRDMFHVDYGDKLKLNVTS